MNKLLRLSVAVLLLLATGCSKENEDTSLSVTFNVDAPVAMGANSSRYIRYTVKSALPDITIGVTSSADITTSVVADKATKLTGTIRVITGAVVDEYSKMEVSVSNGKSTVTKNFTFEEASIQVVDNATKVATAERGNVVLEYLSNTECQAVIPADARSWISVMPVTRALTQQSITLMLSPNTEYDRSAVVTVQSVDGSVAIDYTIEQKGEWGEYHEPWVDGEVVTYMKSDKQKDVPLIFIGDGFTAEQMVANGKYDQVMTASINGIFDVEPFKSYKEYFSVYIVVAVSNKEGVGTPGHPVDNVFNTRLEGENVRTDDDALLRYAEKVGLSGDVGAVVLLANNNGHFASSNATLPPAWRNGGIVRTCATTRGVFYDIPVTIHELGHGFAALSDVYYITDDEPTEFDRKWLAEEHALGHVLNISYTDDPAKVPWAHLLNHPNYPYVGIIEGAIHSKGAWRSEGGSLMGDIIDYPEYGITGPYLDAISREAIVKRIKAMAGETYSFDEFVAKDRYEPNLEVPWW
jgi:hypothetical protein